MFRPSLLSWAYQAVALRKLARFILWIRVLNGEAEIAELCLNFSAPLDLANRDALLNAITLEQEDRRVALTARDLNLTNDQICLQNLQHDRDYQLTVKPFLNRDGVKLDKAIEISFTVPMRKPRLTFVAAPENGDPLTEPPQLQAVNVKELHLILYRIADPALYPEAWRQYQQATLAPSESLTFAHEKGQEFWQSNLVLNEAPNQAQNATPPLAGIAAGSLFSHRRAAHSAQRHSSRSQIGGLASGLSARLCALSTQITSDGTHIFASTASSARREHRRASPG